MRVSEGRGQNAGGSGRGQVFGVVATWPHELVVLNDRSKLGHAEPHRRVGGSTAPGAHLNAGAAIRDGTPPHRYACQNGDGRRDGGERPDRWRDGVQGAEVRHERQALDRAGPEGSNEDKGRDAATAAVTTVVTLWDLA